MKTVECQTDDTNVEEKVLRRLLATGPDHKTKAKSGASPKKRGRPVKQKEPGN
jgi:hypothetical protein